MILKKEPYEPIKIEVFLMKTEDVLTDNSELPHIPGQMEWEIF